MTFESAEQEHGANIEHLRPGFPHPLTLHAETLISNLEHDLAFARSHVGKAEIDLANLKRILGQ
jgi:hypothetical protein